MFKRFTQFALLSLTLLAAAVSFASSSPDLNGLMKNNVYTNSVLDFSIKLPEDWNTTTRKNAKNADLNAVLEMVKHDSIALFTASAHPGKPENTGIIAKVFKLYPADRGEFAVNEQVLEQIRFALFRFSKTKPEFAGAIRHTQLGGLEFASMEVKFDINGYVAQETMYAAVRKDYVLFFITTYNNKEQEITLQKTFNTMLFY